MTKKCVLIVEDSSAQAMAKIYLLESSGLEVLWARNGWEGIEMACQRLPQAIVLDVEMPEIDGFEVCRRLKAQPSTAMIPVIMHTVRDFAPDLLFSMEMGAVDFIPKDGYSGPVLLATLRELGVLDASAGKGNPGGD